MLLELGVVYYLYLHAQLPLFFHETKGVNKSSLLLICESGFISVRDMLCLLQAAGGWKHRCAGGIEPPAHRVALPKWHTSSARPAVANSSTPCDSSGVVAPSTSQAA